MKKIDPKRMKLIKDTLENTGRFTSSMLRVAFGLTPKMAKQYLSEIKKDKEFVARVKKDAEERPILLKKYSSEITKYFKTKEAFEYFTLVDLMVRFGIKYSMASTIVHQLRQKEIVEDQSYYRLINKK
jgi:predicted transcriptional regulator